MSRVARVFFLFAYSFALVLGEGVHIHGLLEESDEQQHDQPYSLIFHAHGENPEHDHESRPSEETTENDHHHTVTFLDLIAVSTSISNQKQLTCFSQSNPATLQEVLASLTFSEKAIAFLEEISPPIPIHTGHLHSDSSPPLS